ncbi:MAG: hypothetical protein WC969_10110 [Elusimicrobiota bacterium]|jgi:hypothetical protein
MKRTLSSKVLALATTLALLAGTTPQAFAQVVVAAGRTAAVPVVTGAAGVVRPVALPTGLSIVGGSNAALPLALPTLVGQSVRALPTAAPSAVPVAAQSAAIQVLPAEAAKTAPVQAAAVKAAPVVVAPAAPAAAEEQAVAQEKAGRGIIARVIRALRGEKTSELFVGGRVRGQGILPSEEPTEVNGIPLDQRPSMPSKGVRIDRSSLPGQQRSLLARIFTTNAADTLALPGSPKDAAGVEAALRKLIAADPARFGGVTADDLYTILAQKVAGQAGLTDTVYVSFRQQLNNVPMEGSFLTFTVKFIGGKAVIIHTAAQLFPKVAVDTEGKLDEQAILEKASKRLGNLPNAAEDLLDLGVKVMQVQGVWRTVSLKQSKSLSLLVAVDINTGESFAWDPRVHVEADGTQPSGTKVPVPGEVVGRGVKDGPMKTGVEPDVLPLGHIEIKTADGKTFYADENGYFTVEGVGDQPVQLTVRLSGRFTTVSNRSGQNLTVTVVAKPGEKLRAVFNPTGAAEEDLAQVNAYSHITMVHDWLIKQGVDLEAMKRALPVYTNIDDECNAYYTPYNPSLNFFKSSVNCSNSSYNDVSMHEYGHYIDDMAHGGIPNGGLSEGWGDAFAMYITNQPVIGRGFLRQQQPDYIRHGENKYQYRSRDEVHAQGQAFMGFAWKLRAGMVAAMGEAQGAALATALVIPAILASARDIPQAIQNILMRDVNADGVAPHFDLIAAAAKAHGLTLKKPGSAGPLVVIDNDGPDPIESNDPWGDPWGDMLKGVKRTAKALTNLRVANLRASQTVPAAKAPAGLLAAGVETDPSQVRAKLTFTVGALLRGRVKRELSKFLDQQDGITYSLKEYKGLLESDFLLVIDGPQAKVAPVTKAIENWFRELERN